MFKDTIEIIEHLFVSHLRIKQNGYLYIANCFQIMHF